jgi:hypothetical protein
MHEPANAPGDIPILGVRRYIESRPSTIHPHKFVWILAERGKSGTPQHSPTRCANSIEVFRKRQRMRQPHNGRA